MNIKKIVNKINNGHIVSIKSETVFGLYGKLTKDLAIQINTLKDRPTETPLQISAHSLAEIIKYIDVTNLQKEILEESLPGNRSFLVRASNKGRALGFKNIMLRIPTNEEAPILSNVLKGTGPLWSTSANKHGRSPLSKAHKIKKTFKILVVNDKDSKFSNKPSTIVDLTTKGIRISKR